MANTQRTVSCEQTYHYSWHQLRLPVDAVERLAKTLDNIHGVTARPGSQGRDLHIVVSGRTQAEVEKIAFTKVASTIRHAAEKAKLQAVKEDNAILAFLKS